MSPFSNYWIFVSLNSHGGFRRTSLDSVKAWFEQQFIHSSSKFEISDPFIQTQLSHLLTHPSHPDRTVAELCLRCFISHQIYRACYQISERFGENYGFTCNDLLPYVLNDDLRAEPTFLSLAKQILQTFNPERGNLNSWITLRVRHHRELNIFLLERGLYLISDWAILNDTEPQQLERILLEFHQLPGSEIEKAVDLLKQYHAVYRFDLQQQRSSRIGRSCPSPTDEQLQRISQGLLKSVNTASTRILQRLQDLAELLRQYRIHVKGGTQRHSSINDPKVAPQLKGLLAPQLEEEEEQTTFLTRFRQEFENCLQDAIVHTTQQRVTELQKKSAEKAQHFLKAMCLLHCRGMKMGEIAPQIDLQQQYQVTRLLNLDLFRAGVRRYMLLALRDSLLQKTNIFLNPDRLQQVDAALEELISEVIQESENEMTRSRNQPLRSRFARSLCQTLHSVPDCQDGFTNT